MPMSPLAEFLFNAVFSFWSLPAVLLIGFFVRGRPGVRPTAVLALGATPVLLVLVEAATAGCFQRTDCMTLFGMIVAASLGMGWMVVAIAGMALRALFERRR